MPAIKLFNFMMGYREFWFRLSIVTFLSVNAFATTHKHYR